MINPEPPDLNAYRITTQPDPYEGFRVALGYRVGNVLYISGQAAYDENGHVVGAGDFDVQAWVVFRNLERVLVAAGSDFSKVVKLTILLTDMAHYGKVVALRDQYFAEPYPADTIAEVAALPHPDLLLEIEAIALAKGRRLE